jgi:hypothetical protein
MGPPSSMWSVIDRNVIKRHIPVVLISTFTFCLVCVSIHDEGDDDNEHAIALENW